MTAAMIAAADVPNRLYGVTINNEGEAI